jgi:thiamine pyrophosphokinase
LTAFIVANGEQNDYGFARALLTGKSCILACDGGLRHCRAMGIVPCCIIGDMDSVDARLLDESHNVPVLGYPTDKDLTDLEIAISHACDLGANDIVVLGGLGGRVDHMLGNIHALAAAVQRGARAALRDRHTKVSLIKDYCRLNAAEGGTVTLLPLTTAAEGIVTKGLKYPLNDESLEAGYARGVSNEIISEWAEVQLKKGLLVVIQTKTADYFL